MDLYTFGNVFSVVMFVLLVLFVMACMYALQEWAQHKAEVMMERERTLVQLIKPVRITRRLCLRCPCCMKSKNPEINKKVYEILRQYRTNLEHQRACRRKIVFYKGLSEFLSFIMCLRPGNVPPI